MLDERHLVLLLLHLRATGSLAGVEDVHRFEVESADRTHEGFFEVLLHGALHPVVLVQLQVCVVQALAKHFNLFAVVRTDGLDLKFDSLVEVFLFLLLSPSHVRLDPALPNLSQSLLLVVAQTVLYHLARVFAPLSILLELEEATELDSSKPSHRPALVCPEC